MTLELTYPEIAVKSGGTIHENLDTPHLIEMALRRTSARRF
jgi:phosphoenolpyruvate carboxykinase (ATP)